MYTKKQVDHLIKLAYIDGLTDGQMWSRENRMVRTGFLPKKGALPSTFDGMFTRSNTFMMLDFLQDHTPEQFVSSGRGRIEINFYGKHTSYIERFWDSKKNKRNKEGCNVPNRH